MDWIDEAERELMERLLALLVALAGLADRADSFPMLLRLPILLVLSRAERVAGSCLPGLCPEAAVLADDAGLADGSWAERLSVRFRALAAALSAMLAQTLPSVRTLLRGAAFGAGTVRLVLPAAFVPQAVLSRLAPDTS